MQSRIRHQRSSARRTRAAVWKKGHNAMTETADQLATVMLDGSLLSFGHAVLINAVRGWHVALYELPARTRDALIKGGHLVVETVAGRHLAGDVVPEFATSRGEYVLLTGVGLLRFQSSRMAV
jgi:hypothetical protein